MYSNEPVEEELAYIDTSPEGAGDTIKFEYFADDETESLISATISLDNGQGGSPDYTCTYTFNQDGTGETSCKGKFTNST